MEIEHVGPFEVNDISAFDLKEWYDNPEESISFGVPELDSEMGGGLEPGTLTTITGFTKQGKSHFLDGIATNLASDGRLVLQIFNEASQKQVAVMHCCRFTGLRYKDIVNRRLSEQEREIFDNYNQNPPQLPLVVATALSHTVEDVRDLIGEVILKADGRTPVVIIDHAGRIRVDGDYPENERNGVIWNGLKNLAVFQNVPIVTAAQESRTGKKEGKPSLLGTGYSNRINEISDNILFVRKVEGCNDRVMVYAEGSTRWLSGNFSVNCYLDYDRFYFGDPSTSPMVLNFNNTVPPVFERNTVPIIAVDKEWEATTSQFYNQKEL